MAVEFLHELNVPFFKVGSGDTNNFPYLKKTAQKGLHSFFFIFYFNMDNGQSMTAPEIATELHFIGSPWAGETKTHNITKTFIRNNIYNKNSHLKKKSTFQII